MGRGSPSDDRFALEEARARFEATLRGALKTPPKPKPKPKPIAKTAASSPASCASAKPGLRGA